MSDTDTKTKYIDITQLPVAPEDHNPNISMQDWKDATILAFGIDPFEFYRETFAYQVREYSTPKPITPTSDILDAIRYSGSLNLTGLCTPSRNAITWTHTG